MRSGFLGVPIIVVGKQLISRGSTTWSSCESGCVSRFKNPRVGEVCFWRSICSEIFDFGVVLFIRPRIGISTLGSVGPSNGTPRRIHDSRAIESTTGWSNGTIKRAGRTIIPSLHGSIFCHLLSGFTLSRCGHLSALYCKFKRSTFWINHLILNGVGLLLERSGSRNCNSSSSD